MAATVTLPQFPLGSSDNLSSHLLFFAVAFTGWVAGCAECKNVGTDAVQRLQALAKILARKEINARL